MNDINSLQILVCDDSITNVMILSKLLENEGFRNVKTFSDPRKLLPVIENDLNACDLLILDLEMPHLTGFDVMKAIDAEKNKDQLFPILILTGTQGSDTRNQALSEGATDYVSKPFDQTEVMLRVKNLLRFRQAYKYQVNATQELEHQVQERTQELSRATDYIIQRMAMAGELRDNETGRHVMRVGRYARILAEGIGLPADLCFLIERASPLHDIGKIGIPDAILLKKGKLDEDERAYMMGHTAMGAKLLDDNDSMIIQLAASIAISHHEKWDGTGYPKGLKGESIPIEGRITAISDVFDALTTVRPYKEPWPLEKAVALIHESAGSAFDPTLVDVFSQNLDRFTAVMQELHD